MTTTKEKTTTASTHTDTVEATATATMAPTIAGSPAPTAEAEPAEAPPHDECDECVLCCYPLPLKLDETTYKSCCGEMICDGCVIAQQRTLIIGTDVKKPIKGSKEEEREFRTILLSNQSCVLVCPFCRMKPPITEKERLKRLWKRIDEYKDPEAMIMLGGWYELCKHGLSKNLKKAEELYQQAYDLGDPSAAFNLSLFYRDHVPDEARMIQYAEEGARRGNLHCNNCLGFLASKSGKHEEAKRQLMMTARSGHKGAMSNLMLIYRTPGSVVSKDDVATTLRTHQAAHDKEKSEPREYAIRLKAFKEKMISTGKMKVVRIKDRRK